ncbi:MAG TPA: substrate-binding domain-containing protein, partial [Polyangiaceae bacterium]|nr:substrate-binding domain-containing protein [Polyangiaceae bacterium]
MTTQATDTTAPGSAPRVLLVLDSSSAWSRGTLRGLMQAAHEYGWMVLHYRAEANLEWLANELPPSAAVIGPSFSGPWPERLRSCVSVAINADRCAEGIASVLVDEVGITDLAAAHLLGRGYRNVTTFRFDSWGARREQRFRDVAAKLGARLQPAWWSDAASAACRQEDPAAIMAWLSRLEKPCGVFALCDGWARMVARYARAAQLRVPEDIALIGVDNDAFECEIASPPLSSVAVPWRSVGEAAARLVQLGLSGADISGQRVLVGALDVVVRRSSDAFAINEWSVSKAVAWIHGHAEGRLTVPMIAKAIRVSRRRLERQFRQQLGRTVVEEIRRTRVELARRLLRTTELPLPEVARRSGFTNSALLNVA